MKRELKSWKYRLISVIAIVWCIFQFITGWQPLEAVYQRTVHVVFAFSLIFLLYTVVDKQRKDKIPIDSWLFAGIMVVIGIYVFQVWKGKALLIGAEPPLMELILGGILIVLSLEAARRTTGLALPIFTIATILYALYGEDLPGIFGHRKYDMERIITGLFMSFDGVFGALTGISASFLFLFMIFGSFLKKSGAGDFFINFAMSLFGHVRGGPAKICVVGSSLFGMITGSVIANVMAIGTITIPKMVKGGYKKNFAGAVEACSGLGAQIMPPVMGGAVFIMMEILGTSYISICKAAFLTACLYYFGIFMMVDLEAVKNQIKGIPKENIGNFRIILKEGLHFFIPPAILVYLLAVSNLSESRSVFWAILSIPIVTWFRKGNRMGLRTILSGAEEGALNALPIVAIIVNCNIISGMISLTGLGLNISDMLISLSQNSMLLLLLMTAVASLIIGMGMPIIVSYLLLAILVAPAMVKIGIVPMAAHLFIFFFALLADLTPPVAMGSFIAAGIAGGKPMATAWTACRIGSVLYLIPFFLIYNPVLMLEGTPWQIIEAVITCILGIVALAAGIQGYLFRRATIIERIVLLIAANALIWPGLITDLVGISLLLAISFIQNPRFIFDFKNRVLRRPVRKPEL